MSTVTIYPGDNILSMRRLPESSVHSIVTDPPYMLTSISKRFGADDAKPARTQGNDGSFARLSGGFMNKKWDTPFVEMPIIDADFANYMAGFIDGEGCFHVHKKNVNGHETYDCQFSMTLRADDTDIIVEMQRRLKGIGTIAIRDKASANPQVRYCISSKADCAILQLVLSIFPLRAKKKRDFEIWSHALDAWINHDPGGTWEDISFYRDQLMMVRKFGSFYKPEILFHYRWLKECYRVLKPGGLVFAFSGSRTGHWQACAMELAGFIHHPTHYWVYGSGFPKAHNAARAIDQHLGVKSKVVGSKLGMPGYSMKANDTENHERTAYGKFTNAQGECDIFGAGSPEAEDWVGWKFGTQSQKPAAEPIYLAQKPFSERTCAANLLKHGVGAFNIDDCRVPTGDDLNGGAYAKNPTARTELFGEPATSNEWVRGGAGEYVQPEGRYPSNLILDGSPEVVAMFPDSKGQMGDLKDHGKTRQSPNGVYNGMRPALDHPARGDSGSAARFFHQFPRYICDTCQDAGWITEGEQIELIQVCCPDCAGACLDPITANVIVYNAKAGKIDRAGGKHPTVKPIALMQYLIRHITPKGGIVLDPFAGSGTTGVAAQREGFDCILMEAEPEYLDFLGGRFAPEIGDVGKLYLTALGF